MGYFVKYLQDRSRKEGKTTEVNSEKDLYTDEENVPFGNEESEKDLHMDEGNVLFGNEESHNVPSPESFKIT